VKETGKTKAKKGGMQVEHYKGGEVKSGRNFHKRGGRGVQHGRRENWCLAVARGKERGERSRGLKKKTPWCLLETANDRKKSWCCGKFQKRRNTTQTVSLVPIGGEGKKKVSKYVRQGGETDIFRSGTGISSTEKVRGEEP